MSEFLETQGAEVVLDGTPNNPFEHVIVVDRNRNRGSPMEEETSVFTSIIEVVKVCKVEVGMGVPHFRVKNFIVVV
ncbi:hypothetical protein D1007_51325 [Hordeum vulgare]|nr:hypothetical protein D1007_51325 [Hordeum vulgare]